MLSDLDYANLKRVKLLYNYNLTSMRDNLEMENEANEEFHFGKITTKTNPLA